MILPMEKADMEQILKLWVSCAKQAHPFLAPDWWDQYVEPIRENYTPAMDTAVFEKDGRVACRGRVSALPCCSTWQSVFRGFGCGCTNRMKTPCVSIQSAAFPSLEGRSIPPLGKQSWF